VPLGSLLLAYIAHPAGTPRAQHGPQRRIPQPRADDTLRREIRCSPPRPSGNRRLDHRHAPRRSTASINGGLRILRAALRFAVSEGQVPPPAPSITLLRETKRLPTILAEPDLELLLANAPPSVALAMLLAAHAGLRHGKILHLKAREIDLDQSVVRIVAKTALRDGIDWHPKDHAERVVPLSPRLHAALVGAVARLAADTWLFAGKDRGLPLVSLAAPIRAAFRAAGLHDARPGLHKLRRTWASTLLRRRVDVETVRMLGGWSSLLVVERYVSSTMETQRASELDVEQSGLATGRGVFLALRRATGDARYLRHDGPQHVLGFAPSRSGKGVGWVIPTLLTWPESVLVHDIKGENWALTAGWRKARLGTSACASTRPVATAPPPATTRFSKSGAGPTKFATSRTSPTCWSIRTAPGLAYLPGYGIQAFLVVQDLSQLYSAYGREEHRLELRGARRVRA
jgi:integrase